MIPEKIFSPKKLQSTSIFFVQSWKTGLEERCKADWLSHRCHRPISQNIALAVNVSLTKAHMWHAHSPILDFYTRPSNNNLLFALPWNISTYEYTITWNRQFDTWISCQISIRIPNDTSETSISENTHITRWAFDVLQNSNNCIPMAVTWKLKELTYYADWKRCIWSGHGEKI